MNEVDEVKAVGIMKKMRTDLHRAIVTHMNVIGLTESEEIIERFKRWYLFDYFNVETSRALSIEGLEAAKKQLKTVTLEEALKYLSLPRELGSHPETGETISANIGRFGPYIVHQKDFRSLKEDDVYKIELPRALEIFKEPKKVGRGRWGKKKE